MTSAPVAGICVSSALTPSFASAWRPLEVPPGAALDRGLMTRFQYLVSDGDTPGVTAHTALSALTPLLTTLPFLASSPPPRLDFLWNTC